MDGYPKRLMNRLLDALASTDLSGTEFRIFSTVLRASCGWDRDHCDKLSKRGIARALGIEWGGYLDTAIGRLTSRGMIQIESPATRGARARITPQLDPCRWSGACPCTTREKTPPPKWCVQSPKVVREFPESGAQSRTRQVLQVLQAESSSNEEPIAPDRLRQITEETRRRARQAAHRSTRPEPQPVTDVLASLAPAIGEAADV